ncbi:hypothetical protein EIP98_17240 [Xanthomonas campestris pv. raphani]
MSRRRLDIGGKAKSLSAADKTRLPVIGKDHGSGAMCSFFGKASSHLPGTVSLPIAGSLAVWMPPSSHHGWVHGVFRAAMARRTRRCMLQGPCPPTIAGHAASTSL